MSAEVLREAAALMRSRAEAASCAHGDEWRAGGEAGYTVQFEGFKGGQPAWMNAFSCEVCSWAGGNDHPYVSTAEETAEHIASWHPAVALAVADWLAYVADAHDETACPAMSAAVQVARAYLGRSS